MFNVTEGYIWKNVYVSRMKNMYEEEYQNLTKNCYMVFWTTMPMYASGI